MSFMSISGGLIFTRIFRQCSCFSVTYISSRKFTILNKCSRVKNYPKTFQTFCTRKKSVDSEILSDLVTMSSLSPNDPSSFSRPEIAVIKHISLKLNVEFGKKVLHGDALLNIDVLENTDEVILDIRNQTIQSIELDDGTKLKYDISDEVPNFGSKLTVNIPGKAGDNFQSFFPRRSGARHTSLSTKRSQCCSNAQDCKPGFQSEACCKGCLAAPILNTFPQENEYEKKSNDHLNFIKFGLEYIKKLKRHNTCVASESRKKQRGEKRSRSSKTNERKMNNVRDNKNNNDNEETVRLPKKFPRVEDENISIRSFPRTPIPVTKCKQTHKKGTEGKKIDRRDCKDKDVNISDLKDKTEASSVKIKVHIYHSARAKRNTQKKRDKLRKLIRAECASVQQNEEDFDVKPSVETSPKERAVQCKGKLGKIPNSHKDGLNISKSEHTLPKNESKHMVFRTLLFDVTSKQSLPLNASGLSKSAHDQQNKRFGHIYKYVPLFRSESKSKSRLSFITKFGFGAHPKANVCVGTERIPISRRGSGPYLVKPPEMKKRVNIRIKYITSPNASALQWLLPSQTKGKQDPFLFSQCQPIHARSILPCQDTPAVKFTYDAEVSAPTSFTVLMSALRENSTDGIAKFRQPVPIPSYLLAIAVGMLESKPLGPRSLVWAEKAELDRSVWEFGETEKYLQAAERLCGPYVWGQYDLLVLPPSFPYGGMENPCLTFVTPTLLAGDRSLADVIVHEIMHSWTGNLVTNKNFEHFWLNEGFTVFLERKVHASLVEDKHESKMSRDFASILGLQELTETVNVDLGAENPLTSLVVDLKGVHPDEAFSTVPYEKGSLFLRYLEDMLGGPEVFDPFLRAYLVQYTRKSLNTDEFKAFLLSYFPGNTALQGVDWNSWLYQPGMPPVVPNYDTTKVTQVEHLRKKVTNGDYVPASEDVKQFSVHQMIYLLQMLVDGPPLLRHQLAKLGQAYKIENSSNAEITYRWLRLCAKSRDTTKVNAIFDFINTVGRMKYVRPLYRDLYEWPDVRESAIENFKKNEPFMMHVTAYTLRKDLHLS